MNDEQAAKLAFDPLWPAFCEWSDCIRTSGIDFAVTTDDREEAKNKVIAFLFGCFKAGAEASEKLRGY